MREHDHVPGCRAAIRSSRIGRGEVDPQALPARLTGPEPTRPACVASQAELRRRVEARQGRVVAGIEVLQRGVELHPAGSILAEYAKTGKMPQAHGSWLVEGIGGDYVPPVADFGRIRSTYTIPDAEAFRTCRELLTKEGIIAGTSTGTLLAAALRYCREQKPPKRVVTFVCDSGNKYLSKVYNDYWMLDQGFIERERFGDLRDLIARRHWERAAVTVNSTELGDGGIPAHEALRCLAAAGDAATARIIGIVDEEDILLEVFAESRSTSTSRSPRPWRATWSPCRWMRRCRSSWRSSSAAWWRS